MLGHGHGMILRRARCVFKMCVDSVCVLVRLLLGSFMGELPCKIPVISTAVFQQIGGGAGFED